MGAEIEPTDPLSLYVDAADGRPNLLGDVIAVAIGGAVGASARWSVGQLVTVSSIPLSPFFLLSLSTWTVNVSGAFLLGLLLGKLERSTPHPLLRPFLAVGCLGSFTTFSTFALDNRMLALDSGPAAAITHAFVMIVSGLTAFGLGRHLAHGSER